MPDPIEELSSFEPGVPMSPMSPAEVRRRGERLRRRNAALAIGGAAAAVLLVAVPVAVLASDDDSGGTPQPAAPMITADNLLTAAELPQRDRLTPWEETMPEGQVLACAPDGASLDETHAFRGDFRADVAGAPAEETPVSVIRTEVLQFDDAVAARQAYDQAQGWVLGCPGGDDLARKGVSVSSFELEGGGLGEWRLHEFYASDTCTECDGIHFDRMGIAQFEDRMVLVSLSELGGPLEPEGLDESMNDLFQAAVAKAGGEVARASGSGEGPPGPESLDFPIETGLPSADGEEIKMEGPGPDVPGVTLPPGWCGEGPWATIDPAGRVAVRVTGPEYAEVRELVTFDSADRAAVLIADLRTAAEACPSLPGDDSAGDRTFVVPDVDSGYDDATFFYTYREGLGGEVFQFVRVGHAVLATSWAGEWDPRSATVGAEELNGNNQQLTALMCEYTEEGC